MKNPLRRRFFHVAVWLAFVAVWPGAHAQDGAKDDAQAGARAPLLVLDSGHNPENPGARSLYGIDELVYNDRFVAELKPALEAAGWRVQLTRTPEQSRTLGERPSIANRLKADLFLSIHHDSAQLRYLREVDTPNGLAYETIKPIQGYSIFVSGQNARFADSRRFAELLGKHFLELGRPPTLHHAEPIPGENRPLLNEKTGVYQFDRLAVLRHAKVPAVLLELGVIVDEEDDAYVNHPANRKAMVQAVVRAVQEYGQTMPPSRAGR